MKSERATLAATVLLQMLPATLLTPAVRPLFAAQHGGREGAMHAFMSLNMAGAAVFAPWLGRRLDRASSRRAALAALCLADACLLALFPLPLGTSAVLALRFLEGGAHVGAASLLLAEAKRLADVERDPSLMGLAGFGIMLAVALGNVLGAFLVGLDPRAPFYAAAGCALLVAALGPRLLGQSTAPRVESPLSVRAVTRALALPMATAFVSRFTIGCLVVSFALFAHRAHGLTDRSIGGLFACMTVPFALLTYPASRLLTRASPALLLASSQLCYGAGLVALAFAPRALLPFVMGLLGVLAAVGFASTLHYAAHGTPSHAASRGMALFNAAGCVGMLCGPPAAGVLIAVLKPRLGDVAAYRGAFVLAGAAIALWCALASRPLLVRARAELRAPAAGPLDARSG